MQKLKTWSILKQIFQNLSQQDNENNTITDKYKRHFVLYYILERKYTVRKCSTYIFLFIFTPWATWEKFRNTQHCLISEHLSLIKWEY